MAVFFFLTFPAVLLHFLAHYHHPLWNWQQECVKSSKIQTKQSLKYLSIAFLEVKKLNKVTLNFVTSTDQILYNDFKSYLCKSAYNSLDRCHFHRNFLSPFTIWLWRGGRQTRHSFFPTKLSLIWLFFQPNQRFHHTKPTSCAEKEKKNKLELWAAMLDCKLIVQLCRKYSHFCPLKNSVNFLLYQNTFLTDVVTL